MKFKRYTPTVKTSGGKPSGESIIAMKVTRRKKSKSPDSERAELLKLAKKRERELRKLTNELNELSVRIMASVPVISAIMRSEKLWAMVPDSMKRDFERFARLYDQHLRNKF